MYKVEDVKFNIVKSEFNSFIEVMIPNKNASFIDARNQRLLQFADHYQRNDVSGVTPIPKARRAGA